MTEKTKITLSAKELDLVTNKDWILTKQIIIEKVYQLFGTLALSMQQQVLQFKNVLPAVVSAYNPKISRGENYRGLPYVMLDYPRYFTKGSSLAIRTFFWWGNFFSINLQLAGEWKEFAIPSMMANFESLQQNNYAVCIHTDPWQHHFDEDNYLPLKKISAVEFATSLRSAAFIKIAKQIPVQQWDEVPTFFEHHFSEIVALLKINFPGDEKDLSPGIPIAGFDL